ncbi:MAG: hypothetical protein EXS36_14440 [Pedosphaera sp.]|nr:hypothetical protein [Pedosphaera sp.]
MTGDFDRPCAVENSVRTPPPSGRRHPQNTVHACASGASAWLRLRTACVAGLLPLLLLLTLPAAVQAQFNYEINKGAITITRYDGSRGAVTIPDTINGLPVTGIGVGAFVACPGLTGIYFKGNAPSGGGNVFNNANNATVYYLAGTTGWGSTLGIVMFTGRPVVLWNPQVQTSDATFGVQAN